MRPASQGRVIHVLVDTQYNDGSIMHDLLKSTPADDPPQVQLQMDLLGSIFFIIITIIFDGNIKKINKYKY